jgi:hypothetical protein
VRSGRAQRASDVPEEGTRGRAPKDAILELISSGGDRQRGELANGEPPEQVDTDRYAGVLSRFASTPPS